MPADDTAAPATAVNLAPPVGRMRDYHAQRWAAILRRCVRYLPPDGWAVVVGLRNMARIVGVSQRRLLEAIRGNVPGVPRLVAVHSPPRGRQPRGAWVCPLDELLDWQRRYLGLPAETGRCDDGLQDRGR